MLDQVLNLFAVNPRYDLNIMRAQQSPARVASAVLDGLEPIFDRERPDWLLVQGDTTTAMAAALAASYAHIRIGHIEAGLRTHDKSQPFPEEINRRVTGVMADLHFAPTPWARDNLLREGVRPEAIRVTGNPVIDALHLIAAQSVPGDAVAWLNQLGVDASSRLILVTAHRRENFGRPLEEICLAVRDLAERYGDKTRWLFPVHPNPVVQATVYRVLSNVSGVILTQPLDYLRLVQALKRAYLVLTDSGGLQEEAPGLGVPVLVLRDVTERPEGVQAGTARLVGPHREQIIAEVARLLDDPAEHARMAHAINPYGDGHAAERIVNSLLAESGH
jgi:UDP-N-acetylglucosamine 2-epimerase (non-hydrolysing)